MEKHRMPGVLGRRNRMLSTVPLIALMISLLAACATPPDHAGAGGSATDAPPSAGELVKTAHAATVIEAGDAGVQMCVGAIAASYPPQCGGPALIGWDWSQWAGDYIHQGNVRWGEFALTGRYDSEDFSFTPTEVEPWHEGMTIEHEEDPLRWLVTPCSAPDGGWRVLDAARTTDAAMQQSIERARSLEGFAEVWVDLSTLSNADADAEPEQPFDEIAQSPERTILNVRVVGDTTAATAELRRTWGGMLCVSEGTHTQAELQAIADEIGSLLGPGELLFLSANGITGTVDVQVIYDDTTLQKQLDAQYGSGVVSVRSTLQAVSSKPAL